MKMMFKCLYEYAIALFGKALLNVAIGFSVARHLWHQGQ